MTIHQYIESLNKRYSLGNSTEHTFRGDLQQLIESLFPNVSVTNEPKRQSCGAPDYILTKNQIPVGYIEAKNIGDKDFEKRITTNNKEQFDRYRESLSNLIFTDYINFHLYLEGDCTSKISIAKITNDRIKPITENFTQFESLILDFCTPECQTIDSPQHLAELMASKARLLSEIIGSALLSDEENHEDSTLKDQMIAFKKFLINDITPKGFADIYAQTIAYGLFAARLNDPNSGNFNRQIAAELIPKSNPFLRKLFGYIAGPEIDSRIKWVVENLSQIFLASNVKEILLEHRKSSQSYDPIIYFYETFLSKYDPELRKSRGVWYTPQPIVNFIVRAVDDILINDFDLPHGLANNSKTTESNKDSLSETDSPQTTKTVHRVQILDPATGTGTFLAAVIRHIHNKPEIQQGIWSNYVENDLLPRLNGFEVLMASYAIAHLKLDLLLSETGCLRNSSNRFRIFLTNSLEEHHTDTGTLFASWLSDEANEANHIKRDTPVMCIIGNPPYSGESSNKGKWITNLMNDYKNEPGGELKLNERNPKWINDDYVKFLRFGQHFIEKKGSGILAYINPHGYLDNPTFRGMRWHLLKTYDKLYIIDLHGNAKKKEISPDGSKDENVFNIRQGVSINLFVKTGEKKKHELGEIFHYDLYGKRDFKYKFLNDNSISLIDFNKLPNVAPMFYMRPKDFKVEEKYYRFFSLKDLFLTNGAGITTAHDKFVIKNQRNDLFEFFEKFRNSKRNAEFLHREFHVNHKKGWNILEGYDNIKNDHDLNKYIEKLAYRPFDCRYIFFEDKLVWRTARRVMDHFLLGKNVGLTVCRQFKAGDHYFHAFITNHITESSFVSNQTSEITYVFPLYLYPKDTGQAQITPSEERRPNLNSDIVNQIKDNLELNYMEDGEDSNSNTFSPLDIVDYIYAVLHSPTYREIYKEFLKVDFPRIPYPRNIDTFLSLVKLGKELRQTHLLNFNITNSNTYTYPIDGDNVIRKTRYSEAKVYINETQYFDNVSPVEWKFRIGGYQPAQKWLKDRKNSLLQFEDILHFQRILFALSETDRLMNEINTLDFEHGSSDESPKLMLTANS
ncbi:MAG: N-6 DNA methylase [Bacteroidetes bacterium]|nr:N-6 DNA methylase [Bacteroidota bacterium]